jgi:hypothetical protein
MGEHQPDGARIAGFTAAPQPFHDLAGFQRLLVLTELGFAG